jgi:hypothetical protein
MSKAISTKNLNYSDILRIALQEIREPPEKFTTPPLKRELKFKVFRQYYKSINFVPNKDYTKTANSRSKLSFKDFKRRYFR